MFALTVPSLEAILIAVVVVIILGVAWTFVAGYVGEPFKKLAIALACIGGALWLLRAFGLI